LKLDKLLVGILAFVIVAGLGTPAFAASIVGADGEVEDNVLFDIQTAPALDCNTDTGEIIVWDNSKVPTGNQYGTVMSDLSAQGFTVREINISTDGIPSCVVKLVVPSLGSGQGVNTPYTAGEIDLILDFVNNGGGFFLLNEFVGCCQGTSGLASAFGAPLLGTSQFQIFISGVDFDPNDPATLYNGISTFQYLAGNSYDTVDGVKATYSGGATALIAKEFGSGCVVITGDSNWASDFGGSIFTHDNRQLANNVFAFLNDCIEDEPVVVGGTLIPIDATSLILAGAQSFSWMIPVVLSVLGIGLFVVSRKSE